MYISIWLVVIGIIIFLVYKFERSNQMVNYENENDFEEIKKLLVSISNQNYKTTQNLEPIKNFYQFSLTSETEAKRKEDLIKIYVKYLIEKENLSQSDASVRARFEVLRFDNLEILENVKKWTQENTAKLAESEYLKSDIYKREVENFWTVGSTKTDEKWISEYDLFAPIYSIFKDKDYSEEKTISIAYGVDDDYYNFISVRAKINTLKKMGILTEVNGEFNKDPILNPKFKLKINDIDKIGEIIYKGKRGAHDNDFFQERLDEDRLSKIFIVNY